MGPRKQLVRRLKRTSQQEKEPNAAVCAPPQQVHFNMPYLIDGTAGASFEGIGLVVDTAKGLVIVDRNTVPASLGDVQLSFGASLQVACSLLSSSAARRARRAPPAPSSLFLSLQVPARVEYIHPLHNLAVVSYDPQALANVPVRAATLAPPPPKGPSELKQLEQVVPRCCCFRALLLGAPCVDWRT